MKIISLIPLTRGTGIAQYIASFAMIEKNELMILDLDKHSIMEDLLHIDNINLSTQILTNQPNEDEGLRSQIAIYLTRFYNLFVNISQRNLNSRSIQISAIAEQIIQYLPKHNAKYLIVNYPYKASIQEINQIVEKSDCTILFSDFSNKAQLDIEIISENSCDKNKLLGLLISKPDHISFSISQQQEKLKSVSIEALGGASYNLLFLRATIQQKVLLEYDDDLSKAISMLWFNIKSKINSVLKQRVH